MLYATCIVKCCFFCRSHAGSPLRQSGAFSMIQSPNPHVGSSLPVEGSFCGLWTSSPTIKLWVACSNRKGGVEKNTSVLLHPESIGCRAVVAKGHGHWSGEGRRSGTN